MGNAKTIVPLGMYLLVAVAMCFLTSNVRAVDPEQTTLDPEEIRPVNFYVNKAGEQTVIKNVICSGWPCPEYTVIADPTTLVQERLYSPMDVVVATANCSSSFNDALMEGYMKLFQYRKGNNSNNATIQMSVPVIVNIFPTPPSQTTQNICSSEFEVWFYVNASSFTNGIPLPNDNSLKIRTQIPEMDVFVGTFRGVITDPEPDLNTLKQNLPTDVQYVDSEYIVAMYDTPWKTRGRRNEIWLKKEKSSSVNE